MTLQSVRDDPLGAVRIFAGLSEELRGELLGHAERSRLAAGEWVFRAGEPAAAMYVVLSGRLEVLIEQPEELVIRVLDRGAALGELALLTGKPRSASARARRDSELLKLTREAFGELIRSDAFARELLRALGEQLQASRSLDASMSPRPATVSVVPARPGLDAEGFAHAITRELGRWAPTALIDTAGAGSDATGFGPLLDRLEHEHEHVVLAAARPPGDPWTEFCLRHGDRTFALVSGAPDSAVTESLTGCEPVCAEAEAHGRLSAWLDVLRATRGRLIGDGGPRGCTASIARAIAGRSLGIVLSGGGARGLAHIGVLDELTRAGLEIDRVAGCSMGAVIGAMFASGRSPDEIRRICETEFAGRNPLGDYTLPLVALVRGERARSMGERIYGDRLIEELPRQFYSVSCDLISSELVFHRRGRLDEGVGASMALPGVFPPVSVDDRFLVDGGVLNNLPIEAMAADGEGPIIASDVTARFEPPRRRPRHDLLQRAREALTGIGAPVPLGFREIMMRTVVLGSIDTAEAARRHADVVIEPAVQAIGLMAFDQLPAAFQAGRRAAAAALESSPELVSRYASG
ncbi:MAG: patatin-like phospholipase family protein [Thermoleophilaceae bacterium]|nr:patatin-like phospholipase family protein [Thermoleophilaceae bacterium]